ncbi:hypothetical protein HK096_010783 [Nowakowskiella sp. JEL0078]|nr:hypothetical protein HK096_010783 [Nowakowskiella sp. JEL0078]
MSDSKKQYDSSSINDLPPPYISPSTSIPVVHPAQPAPPKPMQRYTFTSQSVPQQFQIPVVQPIKEVGYGRKSRRHERRERRRQRKELHHHQPLCNMPTIVSTQPYTNPPIVSQTPPVVYYATNQAYSTPYNPQEYAPPLLPGNIHYTHDHPNSMKTRKVPEINSTKSVFMTCPYENKVVQTKVWVKPKGIAYWSMGALIVVFPAACWVPFVIPGFYRRVHWCPSCGNVLGKK